MAAKKPTKNETISIIEFATGHVTYHLLGETPFISHRISEIVLRELLFPRGPKTKADKQGSLKHDPLKEYRETMYTTKNPKDPTFVYYPAGAFKKALANAAVDMPGSTKAQIGRLVQVVGTDVAIYGVPQMSMMTTRQSGINAAPDVTTRAIFPAWAASITVSYQLPILKEQNITNLLAAAGLISGMGDYRPQKGSGNYGQFTIVDEDNAEYLNIKKSGGYKPQKNAYINPTFYDNETEELYAWFTLEAKRRGFELAA